MKVDHKIIASPKILVTSIKNKAIKLFVLFIFIGLSSSCIDNNNYMENLKQDIINVEIEFAEMAKNIGIAEAFKYFADDSAVIMRNNQLIKGKRNIFHYYESKDLYKNAELFWKPDYIETSHSGDLAYTYGNYIFKYTDIKGEQVSSKGIFHTVWKKQKNGEWRFVWD